MSRRERRKSHRAQIRRNMELIPIPKHPYRDSALFYGILSACLVGIASVTGAGALRGLLVGVGFFIVATGFSWWRFRAKLQRGAEQ